MKRLTALMLSLILCLSVITFVPQSVSAALTNIAGDATYKGEGDDNGTSGNYCDTPIGSWTAYHSGKLTDGVIPTADSETSKGSNVEFWNAGMGAGTANIYFKFGSAVNVKTVNVYMNDRDNNDNCGYPTKIEVYVGNSEDVSAASLLGTATTSDTGFVRNYSASGNLTGSYVILKFTIGSQWRITCSEVQIMSESSSTGVKTLATPVISGNLSRMETFEPPVITWKAVEGATSYDAYIDGVLVTKGITGTSYVPDMKPVVDYDGNTSYTKVQIKAKGDGVNYTDSALSSSYNFFYVEKPLDLRGNRVTSADIIIDPGHGGSQPGACYGTRQEKNDTLNMSLKLGETLEKLGYTVAFCRIKDVDDGLMSRAAKANAGDFDLFICIHRNSYNNSASGVETLYETGDNLDKAFAQAVQDKFVALNIFTNRGLKPRDNLVVTNNARDDLPTILVELGFIDTVKDNTAFDNYFDEIALAMAEGCMTYQGKRFDSEATLTVDGKDYTYTGTKLNITAQTPNVSFKLGNGYGISKLSCTDSAGSYNLSYSNTEIANFTAAVKGQFTARAEAAVNGYVTTTLKFYDGFGVEKTIATITSPVVFADPFTFKDAADTNGVTVNTVSGYLSFSAGAMNPASVIDLFEDKDMSIKTENGALAGNLASTGCVITTTINGKTSSLTIVVYGDIDGDGVTTSSDYLGLSSHIKSRSQLTGAYAAAADVSGDNVLSTADLITFANNLKN